ncbi:WG repeat-containing protein, partial [Bacteroidota bacterium]
FTDNLAAVKREKEWGFIDKDGKFAINPQFEKVTPFFKGMAMVKKNGEWGWIDKSGNYIINPQFPNAMDFVKVN